MVPPPPGQPRRPLSILLLADDNPRQPGMVLDHIRALERHSAHRVHVFNPVGLTRSRFLQLENYDVVVVHYSLIVIIDDYLAPSFRARIAAFDGLKVQFIQDEYRWIDRITAMMRELGIELIFTATADAEARRLYGEAVPGAQTHRVLTGYIPDRLRRTVIGPLEPRPIEVGYRGRVMPYWLGALAQEKIEIAKGFIERTASTGLVSDIGWREDERIYGASWDRFIASCRCMLGTESGASIADWDGSVEQGVNAYLSERPEASFDEVSSAVLAPFEGNLRIEAVSPRAFESLAHGTVLVQFPGTYSGLLRPWEHYIPLEKDFSNLDEVLARVRDLPFLAALASRAHAEVIQSDALSYRSFVREFDELIGERATPRASRVVMPMGLARVGSRLPELELGTRLARIEGRLAPRPFAEHVLRGSAAWNGLRRLAHLVVLIRLTASHHDLRRLGEALLRDRELRPRLRAGQPFSDLLRIGILVESATRPERLGFRTTARLGRDGVVRFTSRPLDFPLSPGDDERASIVSAFNENAVTRVVWSHAAVGPIFSYRLALKRFRFNVGRETPGVYDFVELFALAARSPAEVRDAFAAAVPHMGSPEG